MDQSQIQAWLTLASMAVTLGVHTVQSVKSIFSQSGLTDEQQNQIIDSLLDDNDRRRDISARIAAGG